MACAHANLSQWLRNLVLEQAYLELLCLLKLYLRYTSLICPAFCLLLVLNSNYFSFPFFHNVFLALIELYIYFKFTGFYFLQVLDEIHRQPVSVSLSMVSLPAPESIVESFPLKCHKKVDTANGGTDAEQ